MTWAEFLINLHAYKRTERHEWFKVREIAWNALIGSHYNPKKLPKDKERFMPLMEKKATLTDSMRKRILKAKEEYNKKIKDRQNGVR